MSRSKKKFPQISTKCFSKRSQRTKIEGSRSFNLRQIQEVGVFIVIAEETKAGVAPNVQGLPDGAWLKDAFVKRTKLVNQTEAAAKTFAAFLRRAENIDDEDLASGRNVAPMLATKGTAHFGYLHKVQGSCPREAALSFHVGLLSPSVVGQIPFVDADPQQHPMEQFQRTLEIVCVL